MGCADCARRDEDGRPTEFKPLPRKAGKGACAPPRVAIRWVDCIHSQARLLERKFRERQERLASAALLRDGIVFFHLSRIRTRHGGRGLELELQTSSWKLHLPYSKNFQVKRSHMLGDALRSSQVNNVTLLCRVHETGWDR